MAGFEDYLKRTGYQKSFLTSDTPSAGAAAATPATGSQPDLTNRLLQIMSGQLGGTLTGGEKLSALGALLKSVSRGSQTSPQQVLQSIQQQKMAEVQGALQIQQLRKAAQREAQAEVYRDRLMATAQTDDERAFLGQASSEDISKYYIEKIKGGRQSPTAAMQNAEAYMAAMREAGRTITPDMRAKIIYDFVRAQNPQAVGNVVLETQYPGMTGGEQPTEFNFIQDRPKDKTDDQLLIEAQQEIRNGANFDAVMRQLQIWGVKG
jgi:hypothetical protein